MTAVKNRPTARDLMSRNVEAVDPRTSLAEVATFLQDRGIRGVLVRDGDGRPAGVVSVTDLASAEVVTGRTPDTAAGRAGFYSQSWEASFDDYDLIRMRIEESELTVADVMTPQVVAVAADASVSEIARTMLDQHIHRVFVRDGGEIVGLVSTSDLLELLAASGES